MVILQKKLNISVSDIRFLFKDNRILKYQGSIGPGPLGYALPSMLASRKDFNKASATSTFHKPIATIIEDKTFKTPAPNTYNVSTLYL